MANERGREAGGLGFTEMHYNTQRDWQTEKQTTTFRQISRGGVDPRVRNFVGRFLGSREPFHIQRCIGSEFVEPRFLTINEKIQPEQKHSGCFAITIKYSYKLILNMKIANTSLNIAPYLISFCRPTRFNIWHIWEWWKSRRWMTEWFHIRACRFT